MAPYLRFAATVRVVVPLLDAGHSEPVDTTWEHIADGTLFDHLGSEFGADVSLLSKKDRAKVVAAFAGMAGINARKRFGVEHNGLALVVALANEAIQVALSSGG